MGACTAGGPPFRDAPAGETANVSGTYYFSPPRALYGRDMLGEVVFERDRRRTDRVYFDLRILGRNNVGSIKMRSYRGRVRRLGDFIELRSKRCYIFGKRDLEDRLAPLERWDCDHLFFRFQSPDGFASRSVLKGATSERTRHSQWLGKFDLSPLPRPGALTEKTYFAGQFFGAPLKGNRPVLWGSRAGERLRNGMELTVLTKSGTGRLVVHSRPGDFLVTEWKGSPPGDAGHGTIAFTNKKPTIPGIFD